MADNIIEFTGRANDEPELKSWAKMAERIDNDFRAEGYSSYADLFKKEFKPVYLKFAEMRIPYPVIESNGDESTNNLINQIEESKIALSKFVAGLLVERYNRELDLFCDEHLSD